MRYFMRQPFFIFRDYCFLLREDLLLSVFLFSDFLSAGSSSSMVAMSDKTAAIIDEEVTEIINSCYQKAVELLEANKDILENMKDALLKYETIDADQIDDLMNRREVRAPAKHDDKSSAGPDDNENKSEDKTSENDNSSENAQKTLENDDVTTDSEDKSQDSSEKEDK